MARSSTLRSQSSSINLHENMTVEHQPQILASCYVIDAATADLGGLHYRTFPGAGGAPEVASSSLRKSSECLPAAVSASGNKSNSSSWAESAWNGRFAVNNGGVVHAITEECERLFCDALWAVFGERTTARLRSRVMGVKEEYPAPDTDATRALAKATLPTVNQVPQSTKSIGLMESIFEVWDYSIDEKYTGFIGCVGEERTLYVFITDHKGSFKSGLMALFELANMPEFSCVRMIACIDRNMAPSERELTIRNMGWVGFELTTLDDALAVTESKTSEDLLLSPQWLFMSIDV